MGLPHNACSLTMFVAPRDSYTDVPEGLFLLQLPHESQLLASAGSSHAFKCQLCPSHLPSVHRIHYKYRHIASLQGSADGAHLTLRSKTAATGNPLRPNYTLLALLDCVRSPINYDLFENVCLSVPERATRNKQDVYSFISDGQSPQ